MEKDLNVSHHLSSHYPAVVTFKNHLDTLQMSTMQIAMYLYFLPTRYNRINESIWKTFKNATFGACQQIKGFLRFAATKNPRALVSWKEIGDWEQHQTGLHRWLHLSGIPGLEGWTLRPSLRNSTRKWMAWNIYYIVSFWGWWPIFQG